jgi:hypothetical protein
VLPDEIQKQIERHDLATALETQGVSLARPWRATRTALGKSGIARFVAGEILVGAPTSVFVVFALLQLRPMAFLWMPVIGLTWLSRSGRASCLGCAGSLLVPLGIASVMANFDRSAVTALGGFCVTWTWWIGAEIRKRQVDAILDWVKNSPERYVLLLANGSLEGPERASVQVEVHRADQIDSR